MDTHTDFTAELIASAIRANCDAYFKDRITRERWDAEQRRLWDKAMRANVARRVSELVGPKLIPVPSYAVRKQLRERTLKVGR
jgi:hypothetical protein